MTHKKKTGVLTPLKNLVAIIAVLCTFLLLLAVLTVLERLVLL